MYRVPAETVVLAEAAARSVTAVTAVTAVPFNSTLQRQHAEAQEPRSLLTPQEQAVT
jgi:hypothetical protein